MRKFVKILLLFFGAVFRRDGRPKIIFYHDVGTRYTSMGTPSDLFWRHMKMIRPGDRVCFDDGFRGVWDERERFRKSGIRPTVFIAVRLVGEQGYLTWDEIRALQDEYGFTFQCHTWSHQTLVGPMIDESPKEERTAAWYERELSASRRAIERELGRPVDALCFPVGYFSDTLVERCKRAGYKRVYASYPGVISDDYIQPRCLVQFYSCLEMSLVLQGGMSMLTGRYLRLHCVSDSGQCGVK